MNPAPSSRCSPERRPWSWPWVFPSDYVGAGRAASSPDRTPARGWRCVHVVTRRAARPCPPPAARAARRSPDRDRATTPRGRSAGPARPPRRARPAAPGRCRRCRCARSPRRRTARAGSRRVRGRNSERVGKLTGSGSLAAKETTVPRPVTRCSARPSVAPPTPSIDGVVLRVLAGEVEDDLGGAELAQPGGALGVARDGDDARARARGELHGEAADAAAGAGHEHALAEHEAADLQRAQRGDAGDRQRRGLREAHARRAARRGFACRPRRPRPTRRCARSPRRARPAAGRCRRRRPARRRRRRPSPAPSRAVGRAAGAIRRGSARTP